MLKKYRALLFILLLVLAVNLGAYFSGTKISDFISFNFPEPVFAQQRGYCEGGWEFIGAWWDESGESDNAGDDGQWVENGCGGGGGEDGDDNGDEIYGPKCDYSEYEREYDCSNGYRCWNLLYVDEVCEERSRGNPHYRCEADSNCGETPEEREEREAGEACTDWTYSHQDCREEDHQYIEWENRVCNGETQWRDTATGTSCAPQPADPEPEVCTEESTFRCTDDHQTCPIIRRSGSESCNLDIDTGDCEFIEGSCEYQPAPQCGIREVEGACEKDLTGDGNSTRYCGRVHQEFCGNDPNGGAWADEEYCHDSTLCGFEPPADCEEVQTLVEDPRGSGMSCNATVDCNNNLVNGEDSIDLNSCKLTEFFRDPPIQECQFTGVVKDVISGDSNELLCKADVDTCGNEKINTETCKLITVELTCDGFSCAEGEQCQINEAKIPVCVPASGEQNLNDAACKEQNPTSYYCDSGKCIEKSSGYNGQTCFDVFSGAPNDKLDQCPAECNTLPETEEPAPASELNEAVCKEQHPVEYYCDPNKGRCIEKSSGFNGDSCFDIFTDASNDKLDQCPAECNTPVEEKPDPGQLSDSVCKEQNPASYYCDAGRCIEKSSGYNGISCFDVFAKAPNSKMDQCPEECNTPVEGEEEQKPETPTPNASFEVGKKCSFTEIGNCEAGQIKACEGAINKEGACAYAGGVCTECGAPASINIESDSAYCEGGKCLNGPGKACLRDESCPQPNASCAFPQPCEVNGAEGVQFCKGAYDDAGKACISTSGSCTACTAEPQPNPTANNVAFCSQGVCWGGPGAACFDNNDCPQPYVAPVYTSRPAAPLAQGQTDINGTLYEYVRRCETKLKPVQTYRQYQDYAAANDDERFAEQQAQNVTITYFEYQDCVLENVPVGQRARVLEIANQADIVAYNNQKSFNIGLQNAINAGVNTNLANGDPAKLEDAKAQLQEKINSMGDGWEKEQFQRLLDSIDEKIQTQTNITRNNFEIPAETRNILFFDKYKQAVELLGSGQPEDARIADDLIADLNKLAKESGPEQRKIYEDQIAQIKNVGGEQLANNQTIARQDDFNAKWDRLIAKHDAGEKDEESEALETELAAMCGTEKVAALREGICRAIGSYISATGCAGQVSFSEDGKKKYTYSPCTETYIEENVGEAEPAPVLGPAIPPLDPVPGSEEAPTTEAPIVDPNAQEPAAPSSGIRPGCDPGGKAISYTYNAQTQGYDSQVDLSCVPVITDEDGTQREATLAEKDKLWNEAVAAMSEAESKKQSEDLQEGSQSIAAALAENTLCQNNLYFYFNTEKCLEVQKKVGSSVAGIVTGIAASGASSQRFEGDADKNTFCEQQDALYRSRSFNRPSSLASVGCTFDTRTPEQKAAGIREDVFENGVDLNASLAKKGFNNSGLMATKINGIAGGIQDFDIKNPGANRSSLDQFIDELVVSDPEATETILEIIGIPVSAIEKEKIARAICDRDVGREICSLGIYGPFAQANTDVRPPKAYTSLSPTEVERINKEAKAIFGEDFQPSDSERMKQYALARNQAYAENRANPDDAYAVAARQRKLASLLGLSVDDPELARLEQTYNIWNKTADQILNTSTAGKNYGAAQEDTQTQVVIGITGMLLDGPDVIDVAGLVAKGVVGVLSKKGLDKLTKAGGFRSAAEAAEHARINGWAVEGDDLVREAQEAARVAVVPPAGAVDSPRIAVVAPEVGSRGRAVAGAVADPPVIVPPVINQVDDISVRIAEAERVAEEALRVAREAEVEFNAAAGVQRVDLAPDMLAAQERAAAARAELDRLKAEAVADPIPLPDPPRADDDLAVNAPPARDPDGNPAPVAPRVAGDPTPPVEDEGILAARQLKKQEEDDLEAARALEAEAKKAKDADAIKAAEDERIAAEARVAEAQRQLEDEQRRASAAQTDATPPANEEPAVRPIAPIEDEAGRRVIPEDETPIDEAREPIAPARQPDPQPDADETPVAAEPAPPARAEPDPKPPAKPAEEPDVPDVAELRPEASVVAPVEPPTRQAPEAPKPVKTPAQAETDALDEIGNFARIPDRPIPEADIRDVLIRQGFKGTDEELDAAVKRVADQVNAPIDLDAIRRGEPPPAVAPLPEPEVTITTPAAPIRAAAEGTPLAPAAGVVADTADDVAETLADTTRVAAAALPEGPARQAAEGLADNLGPTATRLPVVEGNPSQGTATLKTAGAQDLVHFTDDPSHQVTISGKSYTVSPQYFKDGGGRVFVPIRSESGEVTLVYHSLSEGSFERFAGLRAPGSGDPPGTGIIYTKPTTGKTAPALSFEDDAAVKAKIVDGTVKDSGKVVDVKYLENELGFVPQPGSVTKNPETNPANIILRNAGQENRHIAADQATTAITTLMDKPPDRVVFNPINNSVEVFIKGVVEGQEYELKIIIYTDKSPKNVVNITTRSGKDFTYVSEKPLKYDFVLRPTDNPQAAFLPDYAYFPEDPRGVPSAVRNRFNTPDGLKQGIVATNEWDEIASRIADKYEGILGAKLDNFTGSPSETDDIIRTLGGKTAVPAVAPIELPESLIAGGRDASSLKADGVWFRGDNAGPVRPEVTPEVRDRSKISSVDRGTWPPQEMIDLPEGSTQTYNYVIAEDGTVLICKSGDCNHIQLAGEVWGVPVNGVPNSGVPLKPDTKIVMAGELKVTKGADGKLEYVIDLESGTFSAQGAIDPATGRYVHPNWEKSDPNLETLERVFEAATGERPRAVSTANKGNFKGTDAEFQAKLNEDLAKANQRAGIEPPIEAATGPAAEEVTGIRAANGRRGAPDPELAAIPDIKQANSALMDTLMPPDSAFKTEGAGWFGFGGEDRARIGLIVDSEGRLHRLDEVVESGEYIVVAFVRDGDGVRLEGFTVSGGIFSPPERSLANFGVPINKVPQPDLDDLVRSVAEEELERQLRSGAKTPIEIQAKVTADLASAGDRVTVPQIRQRLVNEGMPITEVDAAAVRIQEELQRLRAAARAGGGAPEGVASPGVVRVVRARAAAVVADVRAVVDNEAFEFWRAEAGLLAGPPRDPRVLVAPLIDNRVTRGIAGVPGVIKGFGRGCIDQCGIAVGGVRGFVNSAGAGAASLGRKVGGGVKNGAKDWWNQLVIDYKNTGAAIAGAFKRAPNPPAPVAAGRAGRVPNPAPARGAPVAPDPAVAWAWGNPIPVPGPARGLPAAAPQPARPVAAARAPVRQPAAAAPVAPARRAPAPAPIAVAPVAPARPAAPAPAAPRIRLPAFFGGGAPAPRPLATIATEYRNMSRALDWRTGNVSKSAIPILQEKWSQIVKNWDGKVCARYPGACRTHYILRDKANAVINQAIFPTDNKGALEFLQESIRAREVFAQGLSDRIPFSSKSAFQQWLGEIHRTQNYGYSKLVSAGERLRGIEKTAYNSLIRNVVEGKQGMRVIPDEDIRRALQANGFRGSTAEMEGATRRISSIIHETDEDGRKYVNWPKSKYPGVVRDGTMTSPGGHHPIIVNDVARIEREILGGATVRNSRGETVSRHGPLNRFLLDSADNPRSYEVTLNRSLEDAQKRIPKIRNQPRMSIDLTDIPVEHLPVIVRSTDGDIYHVYPGGESIRKYYIPAMQRRLRELGNLPSTASRAKKLQIISDFYQIAINSRMYDEVNQTMFMGMTNVLLERYGFRPLRDGIPDFAAHNLDTRTFRAFMATELGEKDLIPELGISVKFKVAGVEKELNIANDMRVVTINRENSNLLERLKSANPSFRSTDLIPQQKLYQAYLSQLFPGSRPGGGGSFKVSVITPRNEVISIFRPGVVDDKSINQVDFYLNNQHKMQGVIKIKGVLRDEAGQLVGVIQDYGGKSLFDYFKDGDNFRFPIQDQAIEKFVAQHKVNIKTGVAHGDGVWAVADARYPLGYAVGFNEGNVLIKNSRDAAGRVVQEIVWIDYNGIGNASNFYRDHGWVYPGSPKYQWLLQNEPELLRQGLKNLQRGVRLRY